MQFNSICTVILKLCGMLIALVGTALLVYELIGTLETEWKNRNGYWEQGERTWIQEQPK